VLRKPLVQIHQHPPQSCTQTLHIKIALQDHSRKLFFLSSESEKYKKNKEGEEVPPIKEQENPLKETMK